MNLTLSADAELIERTRDYARREGTTLNRLIRRFMADVTGSPTRVQAAKEFADLARQGAGHSPRGYKFDREEAHRRR